MKKSNFEMRSNSTLKIQEICVLLAIIFISKVYSFPKDDDQKYTKNGRIEDFGSQIKMIEY
jgi:hypothetical protein